jgi:pyruvate/2-oxoglutarate dehydrogenase complex dihydrolipoamide acyltransferase (E2) component
VRWDFRFPDVGEGLHEGTLVEWLASEGDTLHVDDPLARVETDKAVVDIPAPVQAKIVSLHFAAGEVMEVGQVMVSFELAEGVSPPVERPGSEAKPPPERKESQPVVDAAPPTHRSRDPRDYRATPHTRALARRLGIALADIVPTGKAGRITDEDVHRAHAPSAAPQSPPPIEYPAADGESASTVVGWAPTAPAIPTAVANARPATPGASTSLVASDHGPVERVRISHLRKVIAQAMTNSHQQVVPVTHVDEVDVTDLLTFYARAKRKVEGTVKFSMLPYFIKAVVNSLIHHPMLNATYDQDAQELILKRYYNIGVAVDTAEGLVVPVVKNADQKDLLSLAAEVADLAERARNRRLQLAELKGASFTVSSIGPMGGAFATPIIQHPQVAIVGLHAIKERPAVVDGEIVIRKMMFISCSYDHRVVDGAVAARFMAQLVELIENPDLLLLRL